LYPEEALEVIMMMRTRAPVKVETRTSKIKTARHGNEEETRVK
jgi:hypothetical protein